jgi:uncharacterized membrane protein
MHYPVKINWKTEFLPIFFIGLSISLSYFFYTAFPERVPIHWNIRGEVDNWGSQGSAAFVLPAVIAGMYLLFLLLPLLDPKKEKYAQFGRSFHIIKGLIIGFMAAFYILVSLYVIGWGWPPDKIVPLGVGLLFIILGNYLPKVKMNWFIGIRTPWTLSSEAVWQKTHRVGGKLFMLSGLIFITIPWLSTMFKIIAFVSSIISMIFGSLVYSYLVYLQEKKPARK